MARRREALVALESDDWDLVISDVRMPGMSGLELLDQVRQLAPETTVILITAHGTTESAVEAMKHGAYDYLTKPCSVDEIRLVVDKALEKRDLAHENQRLRLQIRDQSAIPTIVGKTDRMQEIFGLVRQIAPTRANVLITGESGTGKELIARAIHNSADRRDAAFVAVNCGAIPGEPARERALRAREGRVHGRDLRTSRGSSRSRTAARSSSTRSATCSSRSR